MLGFQRLASTGFPGLFVRLRALDVGRILGISGLMRAALDIFGIRFSGFRVEHLGLRFCVRVTVGETSFHRPAKKNKWLREIRGVASHSSSSQIAREGRVMARCSDKLIASQAGT